MKPVQVRALDHPGSCEVAGMVLTQAQAFQLYTDLSEWLSTREAPAKDMTIGSGHGGHDKPRRRKGR